MKQKLRWKYSRNHSFRNASLSSPFWRVACAWDETRSANIFKTTNISQQLHLQLFMSCVSFWISFFSSSIFLSLFIICVCFGKKSVWLVLQTQKNEQNALQGWILIMRGNNEMHMRHRITVHVTCVCTYACTSEVCVHHCMSLQKKLKIVEFFPSISLSLCVYSCLPRFGFVLFGVNWLGMVWCFFRFTKPHQ